MRDARARYWRSALLLLAILCPVAASGQSLKVRLENDQLHLSSPGLLLLSTEARQRLRDGASVTYAFRVGTSTARNGEGGSSIFYHCVFSYDLWEEKYKVVRIEPGYRSGSHLSQVAAEQLCIDSLVIPAASLPPDSPFWISMEYRLEERQPASGENDPRSLSGILVDIFSRRSKQPQPIDTLQAGPFRLADLRKTGTAPR